MFAHNPVTKGVWRMGTVPPKGVDYKSSLKDYPFGINLPPSELSVSMCILLKNKRDQNSGCPFAASVIVLDLPGYIVKISR